MLLPLKHAPYRNSTKTILSKLEPGTKFIADSLKQAMSLYTMGKQQGMIISRHRLSNGQFYIVRLR